MKTLDELKNEYDAACGKLDYARDAYAACEDALDAAREDACTVCAACEAACEAAARAACVAQRAYLAKLKEVENENT